jgi:tetratricopeptide (TPR) repeat protein
MVNDEKLYRENWRNHPKSDYAINNLAFFLIQQYRYEEARAIIKRGLDISNQNKLLWYNLGITWAAQGHLQSQEGKFRFLRAMDCWKMALNLEPRWAKPREDLEKLTRFLLENKVLTTKKEEAANSSPIHVPINIGALAQSATQEIDNGTT